MQRYFETWIEARRVFFEYSIEPMKIKSIERAALNERWGLAGTSPISSRQTVFQSVKKTQDHAARLDQALREQSFIEYNGPLDARLVENRKTLFKEALHTLSRLARETPETARFPPAGDALELDLLEEDEGVRFPESYRTFMELFDGGFCVPSESIFFTRDRAREEHAYLQQGRRGADYKALHAFPIGTGTNGEAVLLKSSGPGREETPIIFHYHDDTPEHWPQVFPTFEEALICYVGRRTERNPYITIYAQAWQPPEIPPQGLFRG